ncbi:hypothetical protein J6397_27970 [Rhodococcus qingshengii]|jgi:hypothetical protein|uniref:hypothetical protein n=1 Tax=Rhodococcus TaxID=1827 RepID=UPI00136C1B91|nr:MULTISPECIES: hypothetical protein [Rhodococcus]MBP1054000.1 hypothetical protein [Rhodococcus qingshengii]MBP2527544.1 hypothetical protein [Rhodococcus sp. PvP104]MDA3637615.1 hypothetical protein [Rhodococcus sp. C-2]MYV31725.1 hypothetical protein [Rhodococcus erythropolis]
MRARTLVIVVLAVAVIGVLAYSFLARTDGEESTEAVPPATSASTTTPVAPPAEAEIEVEQPAAQGADEAARQGLTVVFTWYPATDATPNDAYGRARNWLTDNLAGRMNVDARTERGPGIQWAQWGQDQAKVIADVTVGCSGCPEDTDTVVQRVATIKQTAVTETGTDTVKPDTTVWVTVVREGDRWLIDDIRY